jgi:carbon-monoxide dehydrogenase large subunit
MASPGSILGTRVLRTEDPELLFGAGRYVADLQLEGALHATFVRSEMANARITGVDTSAALAAPGVVAVLTSEDLPIAPFHGFVKVHDDFARPPLALDRVRFVGEGIAVVLADTAAHSRDAADLVIVDYESLPSVVFPEDALADGAPVIIEAHGSNVALAVTDPVNDAIFGDADIVVRGRYVNQRMAVAPIEPHGAAAVPEADGRLTMYGSTQMPHLLHQLLAGALGVSRKELHVITRTSAAASAAKRAVRRAGVVAAAARHLGRPVTWMSTRSEDMLALAHSRAQIQYAELGCRRDGTFTGLRVRLVGDAGAYPGIGAFLPPARSGCRTARTGSTRSSSTSWSRSRTRPPPARTAAPGARGDGAARAPGRPGSARTADRPDRAPPQEPPRRRRVPVRDAHRDHLRQRRLPRPARQGAARPAGTTSCGARQAARRERGPDAARHRRRGTSRSRGRGIERVSVRCRCTLDGSATSWRDVAHGQGHQTAYAMIVSDQTGIASTVRLVQSDTDLVAAAAGPGGHARSARRLRGPSRHRSARRQGEAAAAHLLEADVATWSSHARGTTGAGVPRRRRLGALPRRAGRDAPDGVVDHSGRARSGSPPTRFDQAGATFPVRRARRRVEVDRDTGQVTSLRHGAVDDCGTCLNPLRERAARHGWRRRGLMSQALYETIHYRTRREPPQTALHGLAIPSVREFPSFEVAQLPRRRRRSTLSARRGSARRARSAALRPCRTR